MKKEKVYKWHCVLIEKNGGLWSEFIHKVENYCTFGANVSQPEAFAHCCQVYGEKYDVIDVYSE